MSVNDDVLKVAVNSDDLEVLIANEQEDELLLTPDETETTDENGAKRAAAKARQFKHMQISLEAPGEEFNDIDDDDDDDGGGGDGGEKKEEEIQNQLSLLNQRSESQNENQIDDSKLFYEKEQSFDFNVSGVSDKNEEEEKIYNNNNAAADENLNNNNSNNIYSNDSDIDPASAQAAMPQQQQMNDGDDRKLLNAQLLSDFKYLYKNTRYFVIKSNNHENVNLAKEKVKHKNKNL